MKLYGNHLSPFTMRTLLVARAKGHDLPVVMPDGGLKSVDFITMSPIGKIPLLDDGGFLLPESEVIVEYLDSALDGPKLIAADPKVGARQRLLVRLADTYLAPELSAIFIARARPEGLAPALEKLALALGYIEHFRTADDSFAVDDAFSIADAALIPLFFFFDAFAARLPTAELIAARPGLAAWWARAKASDLGAQVVAEQTAAMTTMMAQRAVAA